MINESFRSRLPVTTGAITVTLDVLPGSGTSAFRVDAGPEGGRLYFRGPAGGVGGAAWAKEKYLVIPVYQNTEHSLWMGLLFFETDGTELPGAAAPHAGIYMGVFPGLEVPVVFPLKALDLGTLFLPRTPGRMKNTSVGTPMEPENVRCLAINIPPSAGPQTVWIGLPYLSDSEPEYSIPKEPIVDKIGQWMRKEWKSKTQGVNGLVEYLRHAAEEELPPLDAQFDEYGGWTERKYEATGFFRKENDGERWWLVDPAGHPFFSAGVDCISPHSFGPVTDLEPLHSWLPPREGEFSEAWSERHYGRGTQFSFPTANLIRAFGKDWYEKWGHLTGKQMRHWGFNTVANWSDPALGPALRIPYVTGMGRFPTTKARIFRDLPDVFSAEYAESAKECAETLRPIANNPYLIGYFLTNEPQWAFGNYNLGEMTLACPEPLETKRRLVRFLSDRYEGDIARLAKAWNHPVTSLDALMEPVEHAARLSPAAKDDLNAFNPVLIDEYVRVPAEAARRVAPNHLSLGLRWAWVANDAFYAGSRYCDVFSINCYQMRPDAADIRKHSRMSGLPVMIGEFHAGALDVGLPANALRGVRDQHARGQFYRYYVENAAAIPELLGAHYFQWGDQPVLGRYDGECLNIGLVDVCHRPYAEVIAAAQETHRRMYAIRAERMEPTADAPEEMPREGF